jgi:hypothetical protein
MEGDWRLEPCVKRELETVSPRMGEEREEVPKDEVGSE